VVRMNFIVNNAGNITLKIDPAVVLASRAYVDAAILEVLPANKTAGEFTRVKVNNRGVVVSGDNPSTLAEMGINDTYTKPQIEAMIALASALPVGAMVAFPVNKIAPGFLEIDGSVKSIAAYPDLATFLGTTFNTGGEGAGNFRLPESRAEFLRGWDHGRGVDAGRAIGSWQADELKSHLHLYGSSAVIASGGGATAMQAANFNASTTAAAGGTETRPRNLAVMWCVKAWNAPINQGNIDIAALAVLAGQATEINQGTSRFGTPGEQLAGLLKTVKSNPAGVMALLTAWFPKRNFLASDFIRIPDVPGGLIIQWGYTASTASGSFSGVAYPINFPNASLHLFGALSSNAVLGTGYTLATEMVTNSTGRLYHFGSSGQAATYRYLAIGF